MCAVQVRSVVFSLVAIFVEFRLLKGFGITPCIFRPLASAWGTASIGISQYGFSKRFYGRALLLPKGKCLRYQI